MKEIKKTEKKKKKERNKNIKGPGGNLSGQNQKSAHGPIPIS
jgi:hypothetical protein